jgi:hypothetical protein
MTKDTRAPLRAALAAHIRATYGVPIQQYRDAWFNAPDGDTRYPFEALYMVDIYDSLAVDKQ